MSLIETGALEAASLLGCPWSEVCSRTALAVDARACAWKVASRLNIPIKAMASIPILGRTWDRATISKAIELPYRAHGFPWDKIEEAVRRVMLPGRRTPRPERKEDEPPRRTFEEVTRAYFEDLCERHSTISGVADESGLSRHAARRKLSSLGLVPTGLVDGLIERTHGTISCYGGGCRCPACTAANAASSSAFRKAMEESET